MDNLPLLVNALRSKDPETEWLDFEENDADLETIGQDISALANSAALLGREKAYMVWGVSRITHEVTGTAFCPQKTIGNQTFEDWLRGLLSRNAGFRFESTSVDGKPVLVLVISRATRLPLTFRKERFIRIGSTTRRLDEFPCLKGEFLDRLRAVNAEESAAASGKTPSEVLGLLDMRPYFTKSRSPMPQSQDAMIEYLVMEDLVSRQDDGLYSIRRKTAILFARRLGDFLPVRRKAARLVFYSEDSKVSLDHELVIDEGYATTLDRVMELIDAAVSHKEVLDGPVRREIPAYPAPAVREAVANAMIHQDLTIPGNGPVIEVFRNRIDVTNPGVPLVELPRIIDRPSRARNEGIASIMRQMRMCEELGIGWDKIVHECEKALLPAPEIQVLGESTKVTLHGFAPYKSVSPKDRMRAVYQHACMCHVEGKGLTNASLRKRFGLPASSAAAISRLIKEAVGTGLIKPRDASAGPKFMQYVPFWA